MTPRRLFVHVGIDKTGSTAIQSMLRGSPATLSRHGLTYLETGRGNLGSHVGLFDGSRESRLPTWRRLGAELDVAGGDAIVSHEGLYHRHEDEWSDIRRILHPHRLCIVIYLRRQSEMMCSGIAQRIKQNVRHAGARRRDPRWVRKIGRCYSPCLEMFSRVFGKAAVRVRVYERSSMRGGNLYLDFLQAVGIETDHDALGRDFAIPARDPNPTLDVEAVEILHRLDRIGIEAGLRTAVVSLLAPIVQNDKSTFLPRSLIDAVDADHAADNERVARRWLGRPQLFIEPCRFVHREVDRQRLSRYFRHIEENLRESDSVDIAAKTDRDG